MDSGQVQETPFPQRVFLLERWEWLVVGLVIMAMLMLAVSSNLFGWPPASEMTVCDMSGTCGSGYYPFVR